MPNSVGCVCSAALRSPAGLTKFSCLSARKKTRRPLSVRDMGSDDASRVVQKALLVVEGHRIDRRKNHIATIAAPPATPPRVPKHTGRNTRVERRQRRRCPRWRRALWPSSRQGSLGSWCAPSRRPSPPCCLLRPWAVWSEALGSDDDHTQHLPVRVS